MTNLCNDRQGGDKLTHLIISFVIMCIIGTVMAHILPGMAWASLGITLAICVIIGIGKELYDRRKKGGHFCVWDIVSDLVGALLGSPVVWLASWAINATF